MRRTTVTPISTLVVLADVVAERSRQDARWGRQDHPNGTGPVLARLAARARNECEKAFAGGRGTWADIFLEEVFEALAESDPVKLREELVQAIAVGEAWIECIDRHAAEELAA